MPLYGPENYDGTKYSAKVNMKEWGIPTIQQIQEEIENINTLENFDAKTFEDDCNNISNNGRPVINNYHKDSYRKKEFFLAKNRPEGNIACVPANSKRLNSVTSNDVKAHFARLREKEFAPRREIKRIKRVIKNTIRKFAKEKRSNKDCIEVLFKDFGDTVNFYECRNDGSIFYIFKIDDFDD